MSGTKQDIHSNSRMGASASLAYALATSKEHILHFLNEGHEIVLEKETEQAARIDSPLPYRYKATNQMAEKFLLAADPDLTGLAGTLIVDQVLSQLTDEGYKIERFDNSLRVLPKPA